MAQYRYNLILDRWTILATDRGKRPSDFVRVRPTDKEPTPEFDSTCPFCPGNERLTPPESFALRPDGSAPDTPGWQVRVVPNKFPALTGQQSADKQPTPLTARPGRGAHEVIIESPLHHCSLGHHQPDQAQRILQTLRQRYRGHAQNGAHRLITIFYNHGRSSGASLSHPHLQLLAQPLVPPFVERLLERDDAYQQQEGRSLFDAVIEAELDAGERVIASDEHFLAFCPFAAVCPFEAYLLPRKPMPHFGTLDDAGLASLTLMLQSVLHRLDTGLGRPDYNLAFHTAPLDHPCPPRFRWFLQLYPRLSTMGGFELASDTFINTVAPELAAAFYRGQP